MQKPKTNHIQIQQNLLQHKTITIPEVIT